EDDMDMTESFGNILSASKRYSLKSTSAIEEEEGGGEEEGDVDMNDDGVEENADKVAVDNEVEDDMEMTNVYYNNSTSMSIAVPSNQSSLSLTTMMEDNNGEEGEEAADNDSVNED